jgi:hypothetical protein
MENTGTTRHCFYILPPMPCKFKRNDEINKLGRYREQVNRKLFNVTTCWQVLVSNRHMKIKPLYMRAAAVNIKFKIRVHVVRKV